MLKRYLHERASWIAFFLLSQCLVLIVAYLDQSLPFSSLLYIVFLCSLLFVVFLMWRFRKECEYYRRLEEREANLDLDGLPAAESPFESVVEESMRRMVEEIRKVSTDHRMLLEQEKDDLLAWIHEVKTPLTAIRLILDRVEDSAIRDTLHYEWLRIHLLLDQQLHSKRLPFMERDLYIEKLELESIFFAEIKTLQSWCIQKKLGFDLRLECDHVLSDAKWLAFIVRQLLTNAVKYSPVGAGDIVLRTFTRDERTVLEVQDFGRGIDPRDLPRIYEPGFTSTTAHHDHAATGMGLYLARKAADALLIRMDVQSELDVGTTFTLTFPKANEMVRMTGM